MLRFVLPLDRSASLAQQLEALRATLLPLTDKWRERGVRGGKFFTMAWSASPAPPDEARPGILLYRGGDVQLGRSTGSRPAQSQTEFGHQKIDQRLIALLLNCGTDTASFHPHCTLLASSLVLPSIHEQLPHSYVLEPTRHGLRNAALAFC